MTFTLTEINQFLPWFAVFGMMLIAWRALSIAQLAMQAKPQVGVAPPVPPVELPPPAAKPEPVAKPCPEPAPAPLSDAITPGFIAFVKKEEGFSPKAYWDAKQWSIGYGTKASGPNEVITEAEAVIRLDHEIGAADALVTKKFHSLPKGIHQALTDLTYNAGSGWEEHSLGAAVTAQKWDTVKADILQYNHSEGQVNAGLTARREAEVSWFDHPL